MKVIEKRNIDVPNLNIESFGVCIYGRYPETQNFLKYYIPSLEYKIKSLFGNYTKTVYMPILFSNEKEIQNIMAYYSDIYFVIRFKYKYSTTHYSDLYHISNFVDFEKIYKKELESLESTPNAHGIDFVVRNYKGYDIVINTQYQNSGYDGVCSPLDIDCLYTKNNEKDCLSFIKEHYDILPVLTSYSVKRTTTDEYNSIYNVDTFKKITDYIDKKDNENKEREKKLDSMYSKRSFKLVEN